MNVYNMKIPGSPPGFVHRLNLLQMAAPSASVLERFNDGSVNIEVATEDDDALTDWCDHHGIEYKMVGAP